MVVTENLVGGLLNEAFVTTSGVVANSIVNIIGNLVLHQFVSRLLRVWLDFGFDLFVDIFTVSVGHCDLVNCFEEV